MRCGVIARKVGMSQVFLDSGERIPVTLVKVDSCTVLAQKTMGKDGYIALQLGAEAVPSHRTTKPMQGVFKKLNTPCFSKVKEFRVSEENLLPVGENLDASYFQPGQFIDVTGVSVGKGFAGGMKRHGFGGLRASHGVSVSHRSHGSTGNRQDPGKVFKNKKMAGHMGCRRVTKLSLTVVSVDVEKKLVFIKGSVPGSKNQVLYIRDAIKKNKVLG
jgi:large subunit ribosomal protein L3